ncbi:hypothetical protein QW71_32680 [Paenibacillus sp. IHB B 3415]|nr:hypothetical protein QW71_32680 [Paenibacillus sp. IHB B 3415]
MFHQSEGATTKAWEYLAKWREHLRRVRDWLGVPPKRESIHQSGRNISVELEIGLVFHQSVSIHQSEGLLRVLETNLAQNTTFPLNMR